MTLCIAAICTHEKGPAIVLCSDWRSETGDVAGGDVQDKLSWIVPQRWAALKAGPITEADRLASVVISAFQEIAVPMNETGIISIFDVAMQRYRWMLIDHYMQARLGITYSSLVGGITISSGSTTSKVSLPEGFVNEKLHEAENVPFPACFLIVTGFVENTPILCVLNEENASYSRVRFESNLAAIGSGAPAALISLYRREHTAPDVQLMKAVYHVFEAKLAGEISPGVGGATSITVLFPDGRCWDLSTNGHKRVNDLYNYFGPIVIRGRRPKLKPPFFAFRDDYFEPYKLPWEKKMPNDIIKDAASSSEP
jgi:hypothetical protein